MTSPLNPDSLPDPLKPILREVETHLQEKLAEVCSAEPVTNESTGELMRLEDALQDAARAAKDMVSIRRRLRLESDAPDAVAVRPRAELADRTPSPWHASPPAGAEAGAVREVADAAGRVWRVWAVTPGQLRPRGDADRLLGEYREGWLAFETMEGGHRKRLSAYPADWVSASDDVLRDLLLQAVDARRSTR